MEAAISAIEMKCKYWSSGAGRPESNFQPLSIVTECPWKVLNFSEPHFLKISRKGIRIFTFLDCFEDYR